MNNFKFIDLFAGIGGFRLGLESQGFECVFSSEVNSHACEMYELNYGDNPFCDITVLDPKTLPNFDILCGGFPCQAFSSAGKKLGFTEARGTLFFDILRILKEKRPKAFILENVKNLKLHDKGNTFKVILDNLNGLGYSVEYKVLNAKDFGVPQNRERIILVGILNDVVSALDRMFSFDNLELSVATRLDSVLEKNIECVFLPSEDYVVLPSPKKQQQSGLVFSGYLKKNLRKKGVKENTEHLSRVHKQPNRIYRFDGTHPTLSSQESSGRYFILDKENRVRKLTLLECYRLMGFPDDFKKVGKNGNLYRCIGNSVCVPMISAIAKELKNVLR